MRERKGVLSKVLTDWDDELHEALAHPIRRRIIESCQENNRLFSEFLKLISNGNHGKLGFHLRALRGLVELEPSTKKYRLTDRGWLAAELIWDTRFLTARSGRSLQTKPARYARRLRLRDHGVLFYDTEDFKHKITFPFLEAGLLKGEAIVYLVSEHKLDSESREIQGYMMDVDYFRKEAFTIMSSYEWYLKKGRAHAETIVANWQTLLEEKLNAGFTGLRVAGEMEVFFDHAKINDLLIYEETLGRQLSPSICALCLYEKPRLDNKQILTLHQSHGHTILRGKCIKST